MRTLLLSLTLILATTTASAEFKLAQINVCSEWSKISSQFNLDMFFQKCMDVNLVECEKFGLSYEYWACGDIIGAHCKKLIMEYEIEATNGLINCLNQLQE